MSIAEFFEGLSPGRHEPLLEKVDATIRYDIVDAGRTEHRLVEIDRGDIRAADREKPADCVLRGDRAVFDDIVDGRASAMSALLRGVLSVDGDPELVVLTQRLLPQRSTP